MVFRLVARAVAVWVGILVLAVANGALREGVLVPVFGKAPGLVISGLILSSLILVVAYVSLPWLGTRQPKKFVGIGLGWLALTLVFEFSFGLLQGKSWPVLLEAYTFRGGNIWLVVLLVTTCAPYIAAKIRGWV
jgi:hypothetical protein